MINALTKFFKEMKMKKLMDGRVTKVCFSHYEI